MPTDQQPPRRTGGRPPKLSPAVAGAVVRTVALGVPLRHAARAAGVAPQTVYNWMTRGRSERAGRYREFLDALKRAEARAVVRRVRAIREAADAGTWQAAAWWLERCHPEDFATNRAEVRQLLKEVRALGKRLGPPGPAPIPLPEARPCKSNDR